jgi:hypothetical protein
VVVLLAVVVVVVVVLRVGVNVGLVDVVVPIRDVVVMVPVGLERCLNWIVGAPELDTPVARGLDKLALAVPALA